MWEGGLITCYYYKLFWVINHKNWVRPPLLCVWVNKSLYKRVKDKLQCTLMCSVRGVCSSLCPIRPIWIHCIAAHTHTDICKDTQAHMYTHTHKHRDCHLQIQSTNLLLKIQAATFIRRPQPKPSFLQTKGHVCGVADISTSLSLTHSLQRQRLCLVTHRDSVSGSAAWCEPVLP